MQRNIDVISDFLSGKAAFGSNLYSTGMQLYNYNTIIAEWDLENLYINNTKYSKTTSRNQNYLLNKAKEWPCTYINKTDISINTRSLVDNKEKYF